MSTLRVYLKGGGQFEFSADEISVTKNTVDNEVTKITWGSEKGKVRPAYIDLSEIAAAVWVD